MSHAITKRQLREQRRAARQAAEAAERARTARRRRLFQLGGAVGLAAVVLAVAVALSSGGGGKPSATHSVALLNGIPEHNGVLGKRSAPTTVTEFIDLQCPICARTSREASEPPCSRRELPAKDRERGDAEEARERSPAQRPANRTDLVGRHRAAPMRKCSARKTSGTGV